MNDLVDRMRASREEPSVILIKYNQRRSTLSEDLFLAVEGGEDVIFYEAVVSRVIGEEAPDHHFFVCDGKDRVLELFDILKDNLEISSKNVLFFVDNDFDGYKGRAPHDRLYVTNAYSIENYLSSKSTLDRLLKAELKCHGDTDNSNIEAAFAAFDEFFSSYQNNLYNLNKCIFISRTTSAFSINTQSSIQEKVKISARGMTCEVVDATSCVDFLEINIPPEEVEALLAQKYAAFDALNPLLHWRGKYVFHVFIRFLKVLTEDRGKKKNREVFVSRANVNFHPDEGAIRLLASIMEIPSCMRDFFRKNMRQTA